MPLLPSPAACLPVWRACLLQRIAGAAVRHLRGAVPAPYQRVARCKCHCELYSPALLPLCGAITAAIFDYTGS